MIIVITISRLSMGKTSKLSCFAAVYFFTGPGPLALAVALAFGPLAAPPQSGAQGDRQFCLVALRLRHRVAAHIGGQGSKWQRRKQIQQRYPEFEPTNRT